MLDFAEQPRKIYSTNLFYSIFYGVWVSGMSFNS